MARQLMKGNEAALTGALLAGCRAYYGYPITPASELAEAAARLFPRAGGTFIQAESEVAAINMVYGAAAAGERAMSASSGPGLSLMQEGISYLAGAELPAVIVDVTRGGPGLGNIAPEQGDYFQIVKGGGHGCYRTIVLAPASVQEMCDLTMLAFELADRYRNPAIVLADGYVGQMIEPVSFPMQPALPPDKPWAVRGTAETRRNLITSIHLEPAELEANVVSLQRKYARVAEQEPRWETYRADDASLLLVGYGILGRVLRNTVDLARREGIAAGLLRPVTLWPFPRRALQALAERAQRILVVELSNGQMVEDVRLAVEGRCPVEFYGRAGGVVATDEEILEQVRRLREGAHVHSVV
jgi:pyruvate/2-oxoacid:ferredoxin oxidoreductase alpha subunit